jgi:hypothetical protein
LTLLAAACSQAAQGEPVTGRVSDASNAPIAGATVTLQMVGKPLETFTAKTDKDGVYEFREVPDGSYSLEAGMKGHVSVRYFPLQIHFPFGFERDFRLPADEVYESDAPDKAHVAGELKIADKPVGGARVCLQRRQEEFCATTNRLGQYSILVPPGYWQAAVTTQKDKDVVWRQRLRLATPGEYRDQIQIRIVAQAPLVEDRPPAARRPRGGTGRFRVKQK